MLQRDAERCPGRGGPGNNQCDVQIAADGSPFGQLGLSDSSYSVQESQSVEVAVLRSYYLSGAVSVTLTPIAETATAGDDFVADPVTVSWADGDSDWKIAEFAIVDDASEEPAESFRVELSNPTGGAVIGPRSSATVRIQMSDQPPPKLGGGGVFGYLSLLLLGVMTFLRRHAWRFARA